MNLAVPLEQAGEYRFEVDADGQILACTAFIPMRRDGTDPACAVGLAVERQEITTTTSDGVTGTLGHPIVALWIRETSDNVNDRERVLPQAPDLAVQSRPAAPESEASEDSQSPSEPCRRMPTVKPGMRNRRSPSSLMLLVRR